MSEPLNNTESKEIQKKELSNVRSRKSPIKFYSEEDNGEKTVKVKLNEDPNLTLHDLTGTPNTELADRILRAGTNALPDFMGLDQKYNLITQNLADFSPQDAIEARLVTQAAVLHEHGLDYLKRARDVIFDDGTFAKDHWHTIFMKTAGRLLDLYNKTIETLTRYRQRGEQKILVQHVNVEGGGKAIVNNGNMNAGGGGKNKNEG